MKPTLATADASIMKMVEKVISKILKSDPDSISKLASMEGKILAVELLGLERTIYIKPNSEGVSLHSHCDREVDVTIRGTPVALLTMVKPENRQTALSSRDVEVIGDLGLAQDMQSLFAAMDIDWEELLSGMTGDVAAHQIGNFFRAFAKWGRETHQTMEMNLSEWLQFEIRMVPEQEEISTFMDEVDVLRADTDRLEARLKRLQATHGQTG